MVERFHRRLSEQAKGAGVGFDGIIGEYPEELVEKIEGHPAQSGFAAGAPDCPHHFGAAAPGGHQLRNQLRRILQVSVHRHDGIGARRRSQAGGQGALETEVAREIDQLETRVAGMLLGDQGRGAVAAAVVHQNGRPDAAGLAIKDRGEPLEQLWQHRFLVVDRNDDGNRGWLHHGEGILGSNAQKSTVW